MKDSVLWSSKEKQCISLLQRLNSLNSLLQIHAFMLRNALITNLSLLTKFISSCSDAAAIRHARLVFDHRLANNEDIFLCNCMIRAHVQNRQFHESIALYRNLWREARFTPDSYTFSFLFKSCASISTPKEGRQLHDQVIKMGSCFDVFVATGMVDMYAKLGEMDNARRVFDEMPHRSPVSWTAVISGYARSGDVDTAWKLFYRMPNKDTCSFNTMIDASAKLGNMALASQLFDEMPEKNVVSWTSLIYGYCRRGDIDIARSLFNAMPEKNLFSWNTMIGGYSHNKKPQQAIELFREMQHNSLLQPDEVTIVSVMPAIADLGALELGCWVHSYARHKGLDRTNTVATALIDMYAKCGELWKAQRVFYEMPKREVVTWNAMINGFALNGCSEEALNVFMEMWREGIKPNKITMIGVLRACCHGGLVEEGKKWFGDMEGYGIEPSIEHYGCMVDLLGRAGHLEEAEELIKSMPGEVNGIILSSFLFACGCYRDVQRAERIMSKAFEMEPWNVGNYVIMRNMYAGERRWADIEKIERMIRDVENNGTKKEVGCSAIEVDGRVGKFIAGDRVHPQWKIIYGVLGILWVHMKSQNVEEVLQFDV